MQYEPHPYQVHATQHILDNNYCSLFLEMGLGKSIATLTAINQLMYQDFSVDKVLIIAPLTVAQNVWTAEVEKWDHVKHLRISLCLGTANERIAALRVKADIYIINRENVPWLVSYLQSAWPFDMVVIDELSSFKSSKSQRFRALRQKRPNMKRVVGLTGTPAPNGLEDLWPQLYLLDRGRRLGETISGFRERYFSKIQVAAQGYKYVPNEFTKQAIYRKIEDICISMKAADYLDLPGRIDHTITVKLDKATQDRYNEFERTQILSLLNEKEITVMNTVAMINKLLQFASGFVYDKDHAAHEMHTEKIEALRELIEQANGQPVLVFCEFVEDFARIQKYIGGIKLDPKKHLTAWNEGKIPIGLAHSASMGHGLNMQKGGHIVIWYGLPNGSLERYLQACARLDRQGQTEVVMNYRLIMQHTWDEETLINIESKAGGQNALMEAVKAKIAYYLKNR